MLTEHESLYNTEESRSYTEDTSFTKYKYMFRREHNCGEHIWWREKQSYCKDSVIPVK